MSTLLLDLPGLAERERLEPGFGSALASMASRIDLDPSFIGAIMSLESGFHPDAVNAISGATGLIQFMPKTAQALGTTVEALRGLSATDQLPFVRAYFEPVAKQIRPAFPGDYYMATFMPEFIGKPSDFVLANKGDPAYDQNAGLDKRGQGFLTVGDVTGAINALVASAGSKPMLVLEDAPGAAPSPPGTDLVDVLLGLAFAAGVAYVTGILDTPGGKRP